MLANLAARRIHGAFAWAILLCVCTVLSVALAIYFVGLGLYKGYGLASNHYKERGSRAASTTRR